MTADEAATKQPIMSLAQALFLAKRGTDEPSRKKHLEELYAKIKEQNMTPFYKAVCDELKITPDASLHKQMSKANEEELKQLDLKLADAEKNFGETEIFDALLAKAVYLCAIGDKDNAISAYRVAYEKAPGLNHKLDIVFTQIRLGLFYEDHELTSRNIERAKELVEQGGDWDGRNRLKVYEGIYLITVRNLKGAVNLLLDGLATFTCSELMPYSDFVKYTCLVATYALPRSDLKKKVIDSPEILEVIHEIPNMESYVNSLYACSYAKFFQSLAAIETGMKADRYCFPHYQWYVREMRIIAYSQILESYRSVTLDSMAHSFGVTVDYIDRDLARFIAAGRLNCVIDKVGSVVETNRPDAKNAQYQTCIKQGDLLLNRIQKLSRVINV